MEVFIKKTVFFSAILVLTLFLLSFLLIKINPHIYQHLYGYQTEKLKTNKPYTNLFIGDSSLGYSVDSDEFSNLTSQISINCALTGLYGYAGSYNMLKKAHKYNSNLKNVILIQTFDMQTRKVAMDGYVRSSSSISDFIEVKDKLNFIKKYIQYIQSIRFWEREDKLLVNDYIKQIGIYKPNSIQSKLRVDAINANKIKYLIKIRDYCLKYNLNLIYVHGPLYEEKIEVSKNYISKVNKLLETHGINLINKAIPIKKNQLGNTEDHVHPKYKKKFTKMYYELLKDHLIH